MKNGSLDQAAYEAYSPAFYGAGNLLVYGAFFAYYPLTFVFITLDTWRGIASAYRSMAAAGIRQTKRTVTGIRLMASSLAKGKFGEAFGHLSDMMQDDSSIYDGFDDPFTNNMRKYAEVPDWWFFMIVLVSLIFSLILLTQFPDLNTPVWTIFFVIGLNIVFLIPMVCHFSLSHES